MQYAEGAQFPEIMQIKRSQKYVKLGQRLQQNRIYPTQTLAQILFAFIHWQHGLQMSLPQTQARGAGTLDQPTHTRAPCGLGHQHPSSVPWKQRLTAPQCQTERCGAPKMKYSPEIRDDQSDRSTYLSTWVPQTSSLTDISETTIPSIIKHPFLVPFSVSVYRTKNQHRNSYNSRNYSQISTVFPASA